MTALVSATAERDCDLYRPYWLDMPMEYETMTAADVAHAEEQDRRGALLFSIPLTRGGIPMPDNRTYDVPLSRVRYFDPHTRTFHRADEPPPAERPRAVAAALPPTKPAHTLTPHEAGLAAGAAWALELATFAELDMIAVEAKGAHVAGFIAGFAQAAAAVRDEAHGYDAEANAPVVTAG